MSLQRIELGLRDVTGDAGCCGGDACGWTPAADAAPSHTGDAVTTELLVEGMTCDHCVRAVSEQLRELHGVEAVEVALVPGGASTVRVHSRRELGTVELAAAIDEAGYALRA